MRLSTALALTLLVSVAALAQGMEEVPGAPQDTAPLTTGGLAGQIGVPGVGLTADDLGNTYAVPGFPTGSRLKDIARVTSVRGNQLFGYGLVIGLNGTGDGQQTGFTVQMLQNALRAMGIASEGDTSIRVENVAAVVVTADLPAFAKPGDRIDVLVSSIGDAESLQGGTLWQTPLQGADGEAYAVAQGPVSLGGYVAGGGGGGGSTTVNHPTAGNVPNGAYVEREVPTTLMEGNSLLVSLYEADFTTASRVARAVNETLPDLRAAAIDASTIKISAAGVTAYTAVDMIAEVENVRVEPDNRARIVINERTGTIVMGGDVRVLPGAISHGSLQVEVRPDPIVVQPPPLSSGDTVVLPNEQITITDSGGPMIPVGGGATISDVIASLNALGAQTRDMIAILQAMKAAGLILADLEIQ